MRLPASLGFRPFIQGRRGCLDSVVIAPYETKYIFIVPALSAPCANAAVAHAAMLPLNVLRLRRFPPEWGARFAELTNALQAR